MSTSTDTPRGAREEILDFAELLRELEVFRAQNSSKAALVDPRGNARPIPDEIFRILDQVTNALAAGEGITIVPQGMTTTAQQAADLLGISRPTLVRLLEAGDIAYDKPGRNRRVRLEDLVAYQANLRAKRRAALRELQRASLGATVQVGSPTDVQPRAELDAA